MRLENGVTLLLKEDRRAPLFSQHVTVRAGTVYEEEWLGAGISHFLEHVIDDGTTKRSRAEIDDLVESLGNVSNAYTARDHCRYFLTAPRGHAEAAIELFADFLQHPLLPPEDVEVQRGVILNEFNQVDDNPDDRLVRTFYETVYRVHPLRVPIEGYREQFEALTRDDLIAYHERLYVPHNLVVTIVGALDVEGVRRRLTELWGALPPSGRAPRALPAEPPQVAPRRVEREGAVELGYGIVGFRVCSYPHPDTPALFLLSILLGGGESSLLYQELKETRALAHSVHTWTEFSPVGDGLFCVSFSAESSRMRAVEEGILDAVERARNSPPSAAALDTAKAIAEADSLFASETIEDAAAALGYYELLLGDAEHPARFLEQLREVPPHAVSQAAVNWLREECRTSATVVPRAGHVAVSGRARPPRAASAAEPRAERLSLPNGLRLVVQENASQPTVFVGAFFPGGVYRETERTSGVSRLTALASVRRTHHRQAEEIGRAVEERGGVLEPIGGNQSLGFALNVLARDLDRGLDILADVVRNPALAVEDVEAARRDTIALIRAQSEDGYDVAYRALLQAFYAHHPYRRVPEGRIESVSALTADDCRRFHATYVRPNAGVLSVVGDVDTDALFRRVTGLFGDWEARPIPATRTLAPKRRREIRVHEVRDMSQAILCIGYPGVGFGHPDEDALLLLQAALAGLNYPGGRLYKDLRQRQLAYEVSAEHQAGVDAGMLHVYLATTDDRTADVLAILDRIVASLQAEPISSSEHRRVQQMCLADFFIHLQTNEERALRMGLDELYGLGYDAMARFEERVRAVRPPDLQRAAQRYLRREQRVVSIVSRGRRGGRARASGF